MKNLSEILKHSKPLIILTGLLSLFLIFLIIQDLRYTHIKVKFHNLRPFHGSAPVFFKGFEIGKVTKIEPADDYQSTLVSIVLYPMEMKLPLNTTAKLKVHKTRWMHRDYIDLIYPNEPESTHIKNGSLIEGTSAIDIHSYLANISPETYEKMEANVSAILENLDGTTGLLYSIFGMIQGILEESEPNIKKSLSNLQTTTYNTSRVVQKFNNAIDEKELKNAVTNISSTTENIKIVTTDLNGTTTTINQTIPNINTTITGLNSITANIEEITCGIKHTMRKQFGGLRLFFGRPTPSKCRCK